MAFHIAKYWGVMPHLVWHYPLRYFIELRDRMIEMNRRVDVDTQQGDFDWDDDSITGELV